MVELRLLGFFYINTIIPLSFILFISCTSESDVRSTDYDDIMQSPSITATPSLMINSGEHFFLGGIADVKVLEDGRIVVLDDQTLSIHLLTENGDVISNHTLRGRGPGEVLNLSKRIRTTEDNIIAIDDYLMFKISVFQVKEELFEHITDIALESSISDFFLNHNSQLVLKKSTNLDGQLISIHHGNIFVSESNDFGDITLKIYQYSINGGISTVSSQNF